MYMENWDLQAVVRGRNSKTIEEAPANTMEYPRSCFDPLSFQQDDLLLSRPHPFETTTVLDELEELYKPFYPMSSTILTSCKSLPKEIEESKKLIKTNKEPVAKLKKRRNQKKIVKEVKEDGLNSDMWAWRKYGQKPIKGSPYPRSYYRCSSSKGCSARKQVERSPSNPEIFIISYTAEHSHAQPTRRNSLAGSTRNKSPTSKTRDQAAVSSTSSSVSVPSLITSTNVKIEEEHVLLSDELFPSSEDWEGLMEELDEHTSGTAAFDGGFLDDQFSDYFDNTWFIDQSTNINGLLD